MRSQKYSATQPSYLRYNINLHRYHAVIVHRGAEEKWNSSVLEISCAKSFTRCTYFLGGNEGSNNIRITFDRWLINVVKEIGQHVLFFISIFLGAVCLIPPSSAISVELIKSRGTGIYSHLIPIKIESKIVFNEWIVTVVYWIIEAWYKKKKKEMISDSSLDFISSWKTRF